MKISRNITIWFGWILDNLVPPALRDSKWFMRPLLVFALGSKHAGMFMEFKQRSASMSMRDIFQYYSRSAEISQRPTDTNSQCVDYIMDIVRQYPAGARVLDISCGRGYMAELLAQAGAQVTGVDIHISEELHDTPQITYLSGDICDLPFEDDSFDIVLSTHTLEHVQDIHRAIGELRRVFLHKLIIVLPCQREYRYTFDLHLHFFPYCESLERLMRCPSAKCFKLGGDIVYVEDIKVVTS